jgi:predicted DNA-binding antitoxin AbrB/MazE fold protein
MTIHAVYQNGVFLPTEPVELPESCHVELVVHKYRTPNSQSPEVMPLAKLAAIASEHPENPDLPNDLASQHDHYLYGMAKRP